MSYHANIDQMLDVMIALDHPDARKCEGAIYAAAAWMAKCIAETLKVEFSDVSSQGEAFGGTCAIFSPKEPGQPLPEELMHLDDHDQWIEAGGTVAEAA